MLDVVVYMFPSSGVLNYDKAATRYELREAMSDLFELTIELLLNEPALDMKGVVGQRALAYFSDEPFQRQIEGIVRRARQLSCEPSGASRYEITIVPPLWLTTRRKDHRIFQDLSVIDIVGKVIEGYGERIAPPANLCGTHPPREYTVQYGETDHDFIFRILAEEGITSFFDHDQQLGDQPAPQQSPTSRWTLLDDTTAFSPDLEKQIPFVPPTELSFTKPHVRAMVMTSDVETTTVALRDYDWEKPAYVLKAEADTTDPLYANESKLEVYGYEVGFFNTDDVGKKRATEVLESLRATRRTFACETTFSLAPGTRMTVSGHTNDEMNGDLLVTRSRIRASVDPSGKTLHNRVLECMPASAPFRPQRRPKPRIYGTQTAFVVGKQMGKDEIDVDKYGRVKVHFTWDRRETSFEGKPTRFIRVSHGWAGQGYGFVMLPRVGDEVVVAYLEGDPDEPIIVGRVHNTIYTTPLNLADASEQTVSIWKSKSSPADPGSSEDKYNMVRMQDKAGAEMLELRAQRDFKHETLHDYNAHVGHNQSIAVNGSQSTSAGSISMSSGSTISMSAKTSISETAGTSMTMHAGTTLKMTSGAAMGIGAGGPMDITAPKITASAEGLATLKGGAVIVASKGTADLHGGDVVTVTSGVMVQVVAPTVMIHGKSTVTVAGGEVSVTGSTVKLNC
jgi:type VI secretion system secreted protein VgrG